MPITGTLAHFRRLSRGRHGPQAIRAIAWTAITLSVLALSSVPVRVARADELQNLKRTLQTLQERIGKLERAREREKIARKKEKVASFRRGPVKGSFLLPGTNTAIKFGGWVQGDLQGDFAGDPGDLFTASKIPFQDQAGSERGNKHFRAQGRNTRFNFTSLTPTPIGLVKGFFEFDFRGSSGSETISNSSLNRVRHAYVQFPAGKNGTFLFGQTWSNFFSLGTTASSVSWIGSEGGIFVRQAQARYTHDLGVAKLALSIENPDGNVSNAPSGDNDLNDEIPDAIAKLTFRGPWGRADFGWLNRFIRINRGGVDDLAYGWGLQADGAFKLTKADTVFVQTEGGQGIGRYLNATFTSGFLVNNNIELSNQYGFRLGFKHVFNKSVWVDLFGGFERNGPPDGFTGDPNFNLWSTHANIFFRPFAEKVPGLWTAIEYIHGERRSAAGRRGATDRIHFATRYAF